MKQKHLSKEEQVIQKRWEGAIPYEDASYIETTLYSLSKKRNEDFTIEDLRFVILQEIGLEIFVPRAISLLKQNIFAEGDFYEGDLLSSVLQVTETFWKDHKDLYLSMFDLVSKNRAALLESGLPKRVKSYVLSFIQNNENYTAVTY